MNRLVLSALPRFLCGFCLVAFVVVLAGPVFAASFELAVPGAAARDPGDSSVALRGWTDWLSARGYGVDRCGIDPSEGTLVLDVPSDAAVAELFDAGFRVVDQVPTAPLQGGARTQSQYFDDLEIASMIAQVAADHPAITRTFVVGTTFQGREIWGIEISDAPGVDEDEPAIQFNAQHHAREVATSHVAMDVINTLTDDYGSDADVTAWVNDYKTIVVPMVNPDGVRYVFDFNSSWRKNRQIYAGNCTGVDLNRNYEYRWGPDRCGFTSSCSGDTYKGPSAASELETMAMIDLAEEWHFVMATSYHSFGRFIDYPYACSDGAPDGLMPEHAVIDEMMNGMADAIDGVDGVARYDVFSPASAGALSGDDTSWYYAAQGAYSFITEIGTSFEPAFSEVSGIVSRNRAGWKYLYDRLGEARIDVHVVDAETDQPLEADVTLLDFAFDSGEAPRRTFLPFGRWSFLVPASMNYTLRVSEPGFVTQDIAVPVGVGPVSVDVELEASECGNNTLAIGEECDGTADLACPGVCRAPGQTAECTCPPCLLLDPGQTISTKAKLLMSRVNDGVPGDDRLKLQGEFQLAPGRSFDEVRPDLEGARLLILAGDGAIKTDVTLPAGAFNPALGFGWRSNGSGTRWSFQDKTSSPAGGIAKASLQDRSIKGPRRVKVAVKGREGSYTVAPMDAPLQFSLVLGGDGAGDDGRCGLTAFEESGCDFGSTGVKVLCK